MYFNRELFSENVKKIQGMPEITEEMMSKLEKYGELLVVRNQQLNLTAITDPDGIAVKHFADSLTILPLLIKNNAKTLADIGTGAGFPGIPLKICCPELNVLLADSLEKRLNFLNEVISELNLSGISTVHGRAEDLGQDVKYRGKFDVVTARAVAPMRVLSEYCIPFAAKGGHFIAMKGSNEEEDFQNAVKILGGTMEDRKTLTIQLGEETMQRNIFIIKKTADTPKQYPRKAGTPSKKPL